jgi:hypothetical protein
MKHRSRYRVHAPNRQANLNCESRSEPRSINSLQAEGGPDLAGLRFKVNVGAHSRLAIQPRSNQTSLQHSHAHLRNPAPPTHGPRSRKHVT